MQLKKIQKHVISADVVWVGEVHGAIENYSAHKELILFLLDQGFRTIFWEMPNDPSIHFEDGRFNSHSCLFLKWLQELTQSSSVTLFLFDRRYILGPRCSAQEKENILAQELINKVSTKSIVFTGNFHGQLREQLIQGKKIVPCAGIVKKHLQQLNFLLIGYVYSGGEIFNFGRRSIPKDYFAFKEGTRGDVYENTNLLRDEHYWINVGKASPVL